MSIDKAVKKNRAQSLTKWHLTPCKIREATQRQEKRRQYYASDENCLNTVWQSIFSDVKLQEKTVFVENKSFDELFLWITISDAIKY